MKDKEIKVVVRRTGARHLETKYRIEKITGAVTVTYRDTSDPNKPHDATGRVGDVIGEREATDLSERYEVDTVAPKE